MSLAAVKSDIVAGGLIVCVLNASVTDTSEIEPDCEYDITDKCEWSQWPVQKGTLGKWEGHQNRSNRGYYFHQFILDYYISLLPYPLHIFIAFDRNTPSSLLLRSTYYYSIVCQTATALWWSRKRQWRKMTSSCRKKTGALYQNIGNKFTQVWGLDRCLYLFIFLFGFLVLIFPSHPFRYLPPTSPPPRLQ